MMTTDGIGQKQTHKKSMAGREDTLTPVIALLLCKTLHDTLAQPEPVRKCCALPPDAWQNTRLSPIFCRFYAIYGSREGY